MSPEPKYTFEYPTNTLPITSDAGLKSFLASGGKLHTPVPFSGDLVQGGKDKVAKILIFPQPAEVEADKVAA